MKKLAIFAMVAVLSMGLLTACGGGGGGGGQAVTLDVVAGENGQWKFDKTEYKVPAGSTVTVNLTNKDKVKHDFVVSGLNAKVAAEGGKTATGTFTAKKGEYEIICAEPGHKDAGMTAKLIVE